ncbi:hypothetical protein IWZ01DRAFT_485457 [Phyllosticta capitalensis]
MASSKFWGNRNVPRLKVNTDTPSQQQPNESAVSSTSVCTSPFKTALRCFRHPGVFCYTHKDCWRKANLRSPFGAFNFGPRASSPSLPGAHSPVTGLTQPRNDSRPLSAGSFPPLGTHPQPQTTHPVWNEWRARPKVSLPSSFSPQSCVAAVGAAEASESRLQSTSHLQLAGSQSPTRVSHSYPPTPTSYQSLPSDPPCTATASEPTYIAPHAPSPVFSPPGPSTDLGPAQNISHSPVPDPAIPQVGSQSPVPGPSPSRNASRPKSTFRPQAAVFHPSVPGSLNTQDKPYNPPSTATGATSTISFNPEATPFCPTIPGSFSTLNVGRHAPGPATRGVPVVPFPHFSGSTVAQNGVSHAPKSVPCQSFPGSSRAHTTVSRSPASNAQPRPASFGRLCDGISGAHSTKVQAPQTLVNPGCAGPSDNQTTTPYVSTLGQPAATVDVDVGNNVSNVESIDNPLPHYKAGSYKRQSHSPSRAGASASLSAATPEWRVGAAANGPAPEPPRKRAPRFPPGLPLPASALRRDFGKHERAVKWRGKNTDQPTWSMPAIYHADSPEGRIYAAMEEQYRLEMRIAAMDTHAVVIGAETRSMLRALDGVKEREWVGGEEVRTGVSREQRQKMESKLHSLQTRQRGVKSVMDGLRGQWERAVGQERAARKEMAGCRARE